MNVFSKRCAACPQTFKPATVMSREAYCPACQRARAQDVMESRKQETAPGGVRSYGYTNGSDIVRRPMPWTDDCARGVARPVTQPADNLHPSAEATRVVAGWLRSHAELAQSVLSWHVVARDGNVNTRGSLGCLARPDGHQAAEFTNSGSLALAAVEALRDYAGWQVAVGGRLMDKQSKE